MRTSISPGATPASPKAMGPDWAPALTVISALLVRYLVASPEPMIQTGFLRVLRVTSGEAMIRAPPPSETMQHSSNRSGWAIVRDDKTSSTVISRTPTNSRSVIACTASGLRIAWRRVATEMCANWALVVPYWYMWRLLTRAYP